MAGMEIETVGTQTKRTVYYPSDGAFRIIGGEKAGLYFRHSDHLGSTSVLSDASGIKVSGSDVVYAPFGEVRSGEQSALTDFGYTGQRHDDSTGGLMYYGARYYLPGIQHFASADTVVPGPANPQAFNRYSYVVNNPVRLIDPTGHAFEQGTGFGGRGVYKPPASVCASHPSACGQNPAAPKFIQPQKPSDYTTTGRFTPYTPAASGSTTVDAPPPSLPTPTATPPQKEPELYEAPSRRLNECMYKRGSWGGCYQFQDEILLGCMEMHGGVCPSAVPSGHRQQLLYYSLKLGGIPPLLPGGHGQVNLDVYGGLYVGGGLDLGTPGFTVQVMGNMSTSDTTLNRDQVETLAGGLSAGASGGWIVGEGFSASGTRQMTPEVFESGITIFPGVSETPVNYMVKIADLSQVPFLKRFFKRE